MLAVGIDAAAVVVSLLGRVPPARGDPRLQAAVLAEGEDMGACLACDLRGEVGRPVVDDEHFRVRELLVQLLEDDGKVLLLVPCGDEDERPGLRASTRRG